VIYTGDALEILPTLDAESVQCVITSPPYYGLRDYGTATWDGGDPGCDHKQGRNGAGRADGIVDDKGQRNRDGVGSMGGDCPKCGATRIDSQIGLESTPEAYVERLVAVFREVRRVLRDDGTLWLNLGDTYNNCDKWGGGGANTGKHTKAPDGSVESWKAVRRRWAEIDGLKPKDLIGIPWRVAFALQADGWYLRSEIIWAKPNPMPESVTDRPTKSHEQIFLLTKSARYFYDAEAVKEQGSTTEGDKAGHTFGGKKRTDVEMTHSNLPGKKWEWSSTRNRRSVWTITTKPFKEAHFATFPPEIPEICIKAGTSEKGCCPKCGSPWERVVERTGHENKREMAHVPGNTATKTDSTGWAPLTRSTNEWRPTCSHNLDPVPCTVLDPFSGAGTTGMVAEKLGRKHIGIELNPTYADMGEKRIEAARLPLFGDENKL